MDIVLNIVAVLSVALAMSGLAFFASGWGIRISLKKLCEKCGRPTSSKKPCRWCKERT